MFTLDSTIDSIQNSKKTFVNQYVTDAAIAKNLNEMVDAQTAYVKSVVKTGQKAAEQIGNEILNAQQEVTKTAKTAVEQMVNNAVIKDLNEKITKGFVESFWKDAFKWTQPAAGTAKNSKATA